MKQERFQELTGIQSGNFSVLTSINTRVQCHSRSISLSPGVQFHLSFHRSTDQGRQARSDDYSFANQRKVSSSLSLSLFRSSKRTDGSISLFVANELVRLPWVQNPLANPVDETRRQGYSETPRCYHSSRRVSSNLVLSVTDFLYRHSVTIDNVSTEVEILDTSRCEVSSLSFLNVRSTFRAVRRIFVCSRSLCLAQRRIL